MEENDPRKLRLSVQRALLGAVSPSLRAVAAEIKENVIIIYFYNDGEITDELHDDYTCVGTEVIADYTEEFDIDEQIIRLDCPEKLPSHHFWVYRRKEAYTGY